MNDEPKGAPPADGSLATHPAAKDEATRVPRVWVLISNKRGDDSQCQIIARSLGWPFEVKQLHFTEKAEALRQSPCDASRDGLDPACENLLAPPWPDLVISAGWAQEPVARWIKQQSGGLSKLVQLNRPYGIGDFDLVIVPPQHAVPQHDNVLRLDLPLHRKDDPAALAEADEVWLPRFGDRPRPWIAVLIGGPTTPYIMDEAIVRQVLTDCRAAAERLGATLFVSTSPRTPASVLPCIEAGLRPNDYLHRWAPNESGNPYLALLGLCDRFVVTADSPSMIAEIIHLGKPLTIYSLPRRMSRMKRLKRLAQWSVHVRHPGAAQLGVLHRRFSDWANRRLHLRYHRDLEFFRRWVIQNGWASDRIEGSHQPVAAPDDIERVRQRITALFPKNS